MQGPEDEGVVPQQVVRTEERLPGRPYGGKAMLRRLELLETQGLTTLAEAAATAATTDDVRTEAVTLARTLGLLSDAPSARRSRARKRTAAAEQDSEAKAAVDAGAADVSTPETVAATYAEVAADLAGLPTVTGPQWRSVGPWTVTNGQTYGSSRVNVSGRVSALAVDPGNPAHVLAGAANGGVWESRDRGASWAPRTDYATTLTVGALAFDPGAPAKVYCGLGEGDWWSWLGNGVLRSADGGASWTPACTAPFVGQGFYALEVDPGNGQRLFAGTTGGLYVSTDAGTTWTQRRSVATFAIVPGTSEWLASSTDGLFRSTDNGTTWNAVPLPGAPASFVRLAISTAPSNTDVAYAFGTGAPWIPQPGGSPIPTGYLWRRGRGAPAGGGGPPRGGRRGAAG